MRTLEAISEIESTSLRSATGGEAISILATWQGIASVVPCLPAGRLPRNDGIYFEMDSDNDQPRTNN